MIARPAEYRTGNSCKTMCKLVKDIPYGNNNCREAQAYCGLSGSAAWTYEARNQSGLQLKF